MIPEKDDFKRMESDFKEKQTFDRILVFDTETTVDLYQNLKFGYFEIYQYGILEHVGLYYDPVIVRTKEFTILETYSAQKNIKLYTLDEFRKIFLYETFDLKSLCVGFNLPFDTTRIAIKSSNAKFRRKGGFSLEISKNLNYPRLHITHVSSTLSFIQWGNTKNKIQRFRGNFVDLRTLCYALTDKKHTLENACQAFDTPYKKTKIKEHGKITTEYIEYCINDVKSTYSLYLKTQKEFDSYKITIPITKAYTPASIGKDFLKMMCVKPFLQKNPTCSKQIIGNTMTTYSGGRTEDKIRKTPTLVNVLDFLSMYPTVCILQNLWQFVISDHIEYVDATKEITEFIENFKLEDIQNKENWKKLQGIVLVEPNEDIFPVRSKYGQQNVWNVGVNYLTSKIPLWYSITDVIASNLYTGKTPKILKAYQFVPVGMQKGLKAIEILGLKINPYKQDLFKELIEYRQKLKDKRDSFSKNNTKYQYYDRKQNVIKIIANAVSYGIFVEIVTLEESKKIPIEVYGLEQFTDHKTKTEKSGYMFNPIIAVSIPSASRLLLAVTEILLSKHDTTHAYCDTDSMMIPPEYTKEIQEFFQPLNPYNFDEKIFKVEESNVWFYGISSKRYCLYKIINGQIEIIKDGYSSHGLGHLLDPFSNNDKDDDKKDQWHKEIWYDILNLHYGKTTLEELHEKYENKYALSKFMASNPRILGRLAEFNKNNNYRNQFKPRNFCIIGFSNIINPNTGKLVKPLAPFVKPFRHAVFSDFVDYNEKSGLKLRGKQYWKPFWDVFCEYLDHPESKFDGEIGVLQRRHVVVSEIKHIGKESNNLDESEIFGVSSDGYEIYENFEDIDERFAQIAQKVLELKPKDVKEFGISKQTLWNVKQRIRVKDFDKITTIIKKRLLIVILRF